MGLSGYDRRLRGRGARDPQVRAVRRAHHGHPHAGHERPRVAAGGEEAGRVDRSGHDDGLPDDRLGGAGAQGRRLRLPLQAADPRRAPSPDVANDGAQVPARRDPHPARAAGRGADRQRADRHLGADGARQEIIGKVAVTDSPVLIEGESGTGKELVAAAIHRLSSRAKRPFIPVNCSAIPQDLLESEFFGHVRGAFSGAVADALGLFRGADEGTIFLDEIAELSPALQVKLLRVLQEMQVRPVGSTKAFPVDVRVIAATNRDLERAMTEGSFRQDLFYRLNVVRVTLPPLRERREDIPSLINHFLRRFNKRFHRDVRGVAPEALAALSAYTFPGNVRELENLIERAFAMGSREQISLTDLPSLSKTPMASTPVTSPESVPALADVERELILKALAVFKDDKEAAAKALGISRRTIYRRLKEYGVL